jgi:5S rRNA maturation endonuclease (ribonuclease M5)
MRHNPAQLPERTRNFIEHGASEGQRAEEAFAAAAQLRDANYSETDALAHVLKGAASCAFPEKEARNAVRSAFKHPPREPIGKHNGSNGDKSTGRTIAKAYDYTDENGKVLFQCVRYTPKEFKQRHPDGKGDWTWNLQGVRRVPYHLPEVVKASEVWIVEGEKDADTLTALGFTATTNPLGAGKWLTEYNQHFTGKAVIICGDNDVKGTEHVEQVARALHGIAASVRVVRLPEGSKDVSEFVPTFNDHAEAATRLAVMAESAPEWTPSPEADTKPSGLQIVTAFDLLAKDFPHSQDVIAGILPQQARLILSAPAKLGKTRFTLGLCLAIAAGKSAMGFKITEAAKVLDFQAEMSERAMQDRLRKMLTCFDVDETALRERLVFHNAPGLKLTNPAHVEAIRKAIELHRPAVVVFDPLYKFHTGDESSVRDMTAFFDPLDSLIADFGVAIALVHHHGKGSGEGLATPAHRNRGSSTIADWADSLLTLTFEDADEGIVKLAFTLRNAEEPEPIALQRNPETLWFDPLPDYQFDGRKRATKIRDRDVAEATGKGLHYGQLVAVLCERFDVSERTAKSAISRASEAATIKQNREGLYVSA